MQRLTISLPDELADDIRRRARIHRKSVSEVVRDALAEHEAEGAKTPRVIPFIGIGASGKLGTAADMDEILAEHWPAAISRHQDR